jgi:hypothetical protein
MDVADEDDVSGILFFGTFFPLLISVSLFQAFVSLFSAPSAKQLRTKASTSSKTSTSVMDVADEDDVSGILFFGTFLPLLISV